MNAAQRPSHTTGATTPPLLEETIGRRLDRIDSPESQTVTLTSREGVIPFTLRNELDQPVELLLELQGGSAIEFPGGADRLTERVEPGSRQQAGRIVAFAGIGRPAKFFATLEELGAELVGRLAFADHHPYDPDEIMRLVEYADSLGAVPVTTAKDAVRLTEAARAMVHVLPVSVTWDDPAAIRHLLTPYMTSSLPNAR